MPAFEKMDRHEKTVIWEVVGKNTFNEVIVSTDPIQIMARWHWRRDGYRSPQSDTINTVASVVVDRDYQVGTLIAPGDIDRIDLLHPTDLCQVERSSVAWDLKKRYQRWELSVSRYNDSLPGTG